MKAQALLLRRANNTAVAQINRLIRVIAFAPTSPLVAVHSALLSHQLKDNSARDAALAWLEEYIGEYPPDPIDASHQAERCLAAAGYYHVSIACGRARKLDDQLLIRYIQFARDREWFGHARMAMDVAFLLGELDVARDAQEYLRRHLGKWRLDDDRLSAAHAYVGLRETLTPQESAWLVDDAGLLEQQDDLHVETAAWMLIALGQLGTQEADEVMLGLAVKMMATLEAEERSLRAVAELQAVLYLASMPISEDLFARCIGTIREGRDSPILRRTSIGNGKAVISLPDGSDVPNDLDMIPVDTLALAAYALTECGFESVVGVNEGQASDLRSHLKRAASIKVGHFVVGSWEMAAYNVAVLTVVVGAILAWVFHTSGGTITAKPDWAAVIFGAVMPTGLFVLMAATIGWKTRGRVLTGLITWMLDAVGQKTEQRDQRIRELDDA